MTARLPGARPIRSVRDASETTVVTANAVLSAGLRSGSTAVTIAVSVSTPSLGAMTVMVAVSPVPLIRTPMGHVTLPLLNVQLPRLELAVTKVTPGGSVLVSVTPVTIEGPLFVTSSA